MSPKTGVPVVAMNTEAEAVAVFECVEKSSGQPLRVGVCATEVILYDVQAGEAFALEYGELLRLGRRKLEWSKLLATANSLRGKGGTLCRPS